MTELQGVIGRCDINNLALMITFEKKNGSSKIDTIRNSSFAEFS